MVSMRLIGFLVHVIFGLYFLNRGLGFINMPEFITNFNNWIVLIGGLLIIIGGFGYLRGKKKRTLL